jgi:competence protein CoiA
VLGISPDGRRRFAWEAQLASATADDLSVRTATMLTELDGVCWVTDKDVPWVARVPSIRIRPDDTTNTLTVLDGASRFKPEWCRNRRRCDDVGLYGLGGLPLPCRGHGLWRPPTGLTLDVFVEAVCSGKVDVHEVSVWREGAESRHYGGRTVWTAARYVAQEREQLDAAETAEQRFNAYERQEAEHVRRIEALLVRQKALINATVDLVHRETGFYARVHADSQRVPYWAMGVPAYVPSGPYAIICPVASRIKGPARSRLARLLIIVADERERDRVAAECVPEQRIVVIPADSDGSSV